MKTKKIYKENVYAKTTSAKLVRIDEFKGDLLLVFDQTIFFPTGGGQSCDIGTVTWDGNKFKIVNTYEHDGEVFHKLAKDSSVELLPAVGSTVELNIDWERRFDNMQRHCGEHILSGMFYKLFRGINRGFHMGDDYMTIDISLEDSEYKSITWDMIKDVELLTNEAIWSNLPVVITHYDTREEAAKEPLRKALSIESDITIVRIGDLKNPSDAVACCGTHPAYSGQVGMVKIYKIEPNKGMTRIYFDAGERAFRNYQSEFDTLTNISLRLSSGKSDVLSKFESMQASNQEVKDELYKLQQYIIDREISILRAQLYSGVLAASYDYLPPNKIANIGKELSEDLDKTILILVYPPANLCLLFTNPLSNYDCGQIVNQIGKSLSGKGGGNKTGARVSFPSNSELQKFITTLSTLDLM
ncbi:alanyl-tRNA editing protein [Eubacteriales bacterium KG127]